MHCLSATLSLFYEPFFRNINNCFARKMVSVLLVSIIWGFNSITQWCDLHRMQNAICMFSVILVPLLFRSSRHLCVTSCWREVYKSLVYLRFFCIFREMYVYAASVTILHKFQCMLNIRIESNDVCCFGLGQYWCIASWTKSNVLSCGYLVQMIS